jgi:Holliday junction DNA helicase RuvA
MIAYLHGKIVYKSSPLKKGCFVIIDVDGVGYQVLVSAKVLEAIKINEPYQLFTYHHVREDIEELYGFLHQEEVDFFKLLISISGIGPKTALGILDKTEIKDIQDAVIRESPSALANVSGIGQKTAEKIVLGLKGSVQGIIESAASAGGGLNNIDVIEALIALGFSTDQARRAVSQLPSEIAESKDKVREALKILGKK